MQEGVAAIKVGADVIATTKGTIAEVRGTNAKVLCLPTGAGRWFSLSDINSSADGPVLATVKGTVVDRRGEHVKLRLQTGSHIWFSLDVTDIAADDGPCLPD